MTLNAQFEVHPDAESLNAFVEQTLAERERGQILGHLAGCGRCREVVFLAQAAAAEMETAAAAEAKAAHGARRSDSWFWSWRLAWTPVGALAAVVALAFFVHVWRAGQGTESAKLTPQPVAQSAGNGSGASTKQAEIKAVPPAASQVPVASAGGNAKAVLVRPLNSVQASHPFRDKTCEMDGAQCLYLRAGSVASKNKPALPAGEPGVFTAQPAGEGGAELQNQNRAEAALAQSEVESRTAAMGAGHYKSGPSAVAGDQQQAPGAQPSMAMAPAAAQMHGLITMPDNAGASRGLTTAVPAPQYEAKPSVYGRFEATEKRSMAGIAAAYKARMVKLPSGLAVASVASSPHRMLAIDRAGTLFLSEDSGSHWERIAGQWTGRAVTVRLQKAGNTGVSAVSIGEGSGKADAVFEIVNDKDMVWTSTDGRTWKAR